MRALQTLVLSLPLIPALLLVSPSVALAQPVPGSTVLSLQQESGDPTAEDELRYASRELRVRVWHDKEDEEIYERGEELQLYFRTNQDAYVVMYRIDAEGYTEVLWPTSRYDDGFVFGGHTYSIPGRGAQLPLYASNVKGVEYVEAIASEYPFDLRELGLDFRFDMDEVTDFAHKVSGDPMLAVNDINYAITGLEEDVDWICTDWTHVYVEGRVDYARYACESCHTGEDQRYSPYTETCTQVSIYYDWGWHTRWYASFGYYPLYCDAPYYYWDRWYYRPYYYCYYPVYYCWPSYPIYVRPYPVYSWRGHAAYGGDYLTYYRRGRASSPPLYDVDRAREASKERDRGLTRTPPSVARRASAGDDGGRVDQTLLVRDTAPVRSASDRDLETVRGRSSSTRVGVRSGETRPTRTVRSLRSEEGSRTVDSATRSTVSGGTRSSMSDAALGGRRWTRPVVRNERGATLGQRNERGAVESPSRNDANESPRVLRSRALPRGDDGTSSSARGEVRSPQRGSDASPQGEQRTPQRREATPRREVRSPQSTQPRSSQRQTVQPRNSNRENAPRRSVSPPPRRSSQSGGGSGRSVSSPRSSTPRSQTPARGGSRGGSRGSSRGGSSRGGRG